MPKGGPPQQGPLNPPPESLPVPQSPKPVQAAQPAPQQTVQQPPPIPEEEESPKKEPKSTPRRAPVRTVADAAEESSPAVAVPAKPAELPRLGPIMSDEELRDFNQAIDAALASAEQDLRPIRGSRALNARQRAMLDQAEAFARQARDARASDPAAAKSLAGRAAQLSRELAASLH